MGNNCVACEHNEPSKSEYIVNSDFFKQDRANRRRKSDSAIEIKKIEIIGSDLSARDASGPDPSVRIVTEELRRKDRMRTRKNQTVFRNWGKGSRCYYHMELSAKPQEDNEESPKKTMRFNAFRHLRRFGPEEGNEEGPTSFKDVSGEQVNPLELSFISFDDMIHDDTENQRSSRSNDAPLTPASRRKRTTRTFNMKKSIVIEKNNASKWPENIYFLDGVMTPEAQEKLIQILKKNYLFEVFSKTEL